MPVVAGPDLEEPDVQRALRRPQLAARAARLRRAIEFVSKYPLVLDRDRARVAVDAVHDADHAGRPPEPARRRARGREGGRSDGLRHVPPAHASAPAPLHGALRPARDDLRGPGLRPRRRDDGRRARLHEHPVLRLPALDRRGLGLRARVRVQHRRRASSRSSSRRSRCACSRACSRTRSGRDAPTRRNAARRRRATLGARGARR